MKIDFGTSKRIIFGKGELINFPKYSEGFGKRCFTIHGKNPFYCKPFFDILENLHLEITFFTVNKEPDIELINAAVSLARKNKCDFVVGIGGGAVLDTGKAVAAMLTNKGDLLDYLEVVGKGLPLQSPSKLYIAIPTTAGTGSEATRNAVIDVPDKNVKVSMRSPFMLPSIALVDPDLTLLLPPNITASTGMDAFVQVLEPYVCKNPNPMVDMFCRDALPRVSQNLLQAYRDGANIEARENLAWVSLLGGLSLANASLGAVHGFAGPIGGMFHVPHGSICAALLPNVMRVNIENLERNHPNGSTINRYKEIAFWITGDPKAKVYDGLDFVENLCLELKIPKLKQMGIIKSDFSKIVSKSKNSSSMKGNPVNLSDEELTRILELSF